MMARHPEHDCYPGYTHIHVREYVRRDRAGTLDLSLNYHLVSDSAPCWSAVESLACGGPGMLPADLG